MSLQVEPFGRVQDTTPTGRCLRRGHVLRSQSLTYGDGRRRTGSSGWLVGWLERQRGQVQEALEAQEMQWAAGLVKMKVEEYQ
jgi:beta-lactamase class D